MTEINAQQVFDGFFFLLKDNPWLNSKDDERLMDEKAAGTAILFWAGFTPETKSEWLQFPPAVRLEAQAILADFMADLRAGELSTQKWLVQQGLTPAEQAIAVFQQELKAAYPQLLTTQ